MSGKEGSVPATEGKTDGERDERDEGIFGLKLSTIWDDADMEKRLHNFLHRGEKLFDSAPLRVVNIHIALHEDIPAEQVNLLQFWMERRGEGGGGAR